MPIIAAKQYVAGVASLNGFEDIMRTRDIDSNVCSWVGLHEPTFEELGACAQRFGLHPLAVEDALQAHQLPKLEVYGDHIFIVARTAKFKDERIVFGETALFIDAQHIVTVRHGSDLSHSLVRAQLEASPHLLAHGVDYILHAILKMIVENYIPVIDASGTIVQRIEENAFDHALSRAEMRELFNLRRDLLSLQRILIPMEEMCAKLVYTELPHIDAETRPYFRDVLSEVQRVASLTALHREVLNSVMETSALLEQQRQNDITRQLAAWAAILAFPTAIAGIYGMNFENMPELHLHYGYFVILALIAAVSITLFMRFKRMDWL